MQVGKGLTVSVVVDQVLQMKSSQFLKLVLIPEHCLCTKSWQLRQKIEFAPRPFMHTPHKNLADAIFDFKISCLEHHV